MFVAVRYMDSKERREEEGQGTGGKGRRGAEGRDGGRAESTRSFRNLPPAFCGALGFSSRSSRVMLES